MVTFNTKTVYIRKSTYEHIEALMREDPQAGTMSEKVYISEILQLGIAVRYDCLKDNVVAKELRDANAQRAKHELKF